MIIPGGHMWMLVTSCLLLTLLVTAVTITEHLALDVEHRIRVSPHTAENYFLLRMAGANKPLVMSVTPCGGPVHWQLRIPNQLLLGPHLPTQSEHFDHILHMRIPPLIHYDTPDQQQLVLLAGEENERRMKFYANAIEANYVLLNFTADQFTTVMLFVTHEKDRMDSLYPRLTNNDLLQVNITPTDNKHLMAYFNWSVPKYVSSDPDHGAYRFCLVLSDQHAQSSLCHQYNAEMEAMHCFGPEKTSYTMKGLTTGKRHYVSLFLINTKTGGKTVYKSLQVYHPRERSVRLSNARNENAVIPLPDSGLASDVAQPDTSNYNIYVYKRPNSDANGDVVVMMHACDGYIRMAVEVNNSTAFRSADFIGLKRFVIKAGPLDSLRVIVQNDDHSPVKYWLWASVDESRTPFPCVPYDRSVRLHDRECHAVVLKWMRALNDSDTRYCVHIKESQDDYVNDVLNEPTQMCWAGMPVGRKAFCVRGALAPDLLDTTVRLDDLKPATMYRFDISAQRVHRADAQPLPYRPLFARTARDC